MRKSWKEKIDRQPNIERLTQIIEDKLHRHGEYKNSLGENWLETANRLIGVNDELSELMAYADEKRTELEKLAKK